MRCFRRKGRAERDMRAQMAPTTQEVEVAQIVTSARLWPIRSEEAGCRSVGAVLKTLDKGQPDEVGAIVARNLATRVISFPAA